jgi:hypothetical protein
MELSFDNFCAGGKKNRDQFSFVCAPHTEGVKCQLHLTITCSFHNVPKIEKPFSKIEKLCNPTPGSTFSILQMGILKCARKTKPAQPQGEAEHHVPFYTLHVAHCQTTVMETMMV